MDNNEMKFYAGMEDGSGVEHNTVGEFMEYLSEQIHEARQRGQKYFTITIEKEPSGESNE